MKPLVSVIMPVFNGIAYLELAIQSVLQQELERLQFIVVDDGSTDGTAGLIAGYEPAISVITQPNQGPPVARNAGLDMAGGEYIGFIDADELWTTGRLQRQLSYLQSHSEIDILQDRMQHIRFSGSEWVPEDDPFHSLSLSTALFRRHLFDRIGVLDASMLYCDDMDWFLRAQSGGATVARQDDVGLLYRRHEGNLTNRKDLVGHYTLQALLKHRRSREARQ